MAETKRGRGRPKLPEEMRRRIYGVSLLPDTIELLRSLANKSGEGQGELLTRLLESERKNRRKRG
jgi:hypothetical protein